VGIHVVKIEQRPVTRIGTVVGNHAGPGGLSVGDIGGVEQRGGELARLHCSEAFTFGVGDPDARRRFVCELFDFNLRLQDRR
jgi:hypothetical protein